MHGALVPSLGESADETPPPVNPPKNKFGELV